MRQNILPLTILTLLVAALAVPVVLSGGVLLSRHSAARDLPWCGTDAAAIGSGEPLNHTMSDKFNLHYPDLVFGEQGMATPGRPAWNPLILGGVPHAANPLTASWYPPTWILRRLDPPEALLVGGAFHLLLCGVGLLLFLRQAGVLPVAALLGGVGFLLSGWVAARLHNPQIVATVAWIPWGLWGIERFLSAGRRGGLVICAAALGLMWVAGFPQVALLGTLGLSVYAVFGIAGLAVRERWRSAGPAALLLAGAALAGLLLASPQLLATRGLMNISGHQDRAVADLQQDRLRTASLIGLIAPRTLGDPMAAEPWYQHLGALVLLGEPSAEGVRPPPSANWSERTLYPGLVIAGLAVLGLASRRRRLVVTFAALGLLGLGLATCPWVIALCARLPGFDFGAPSRAAVLTALALPALAALGMERLVEGRALTTRWCARCATAALVAVVLVSATACTLAFLWPEASLLQAVEWLQEGGLETRLGASEVRPAAAYVDWARPAFGDLRSDLLRLFLVAAGVTLLVVLRRRLGIRAIAGLLIAIAALDLGSHLVPSNLPVTRERLLEPTSGLVFLQRNLGEDRMLRVAPDRERAIAEADSLLVPNLGMVFGLRDAQGWRELVPRHYLELWRGVSATVVDVALAGIPASEAGSPILDLARVRYLVAAGPVAALESGPTRRVHPPEGGDGALWIYERPHPLPRAWVVHRVRYLEDAAARRALRSGDVDPRHTAVLTPASTVEVVEATSPPVVVEPRGPDDLSISLEAAAPGLLVISDTWAPGWSARIERGSHAAPARVLRAMTAFMAIPVEAGPQVVHLHYEPPSQLAARICTAFGALLLLALLLWPAARAETTPHREQPDA